MGPTTPSDLRLEFSRTVSPEVLGLLIKELSDLEPPEPGVGAGPGALDLIIALGAASTVPASVVVTVNGALDLASRIRHWREQCRAKGLATREASEPVDSGTTDLPQQELSAGSSDELVRFFLRDVLETLDRATAGIEAIAQQEIERVGEGTPEGNAWRQFAGQNPWSDWNRAFFAIRDQLVALRGSLTVRGLDSNSKDFVPLNEQDNT